MPSVIRGFSGNISGKFGVVVTGAEKVINAFDRYADLKQTRLYTAIKRALILVEADASRKIKSGYYKPAIDTGRMRSTLTNAIVDFNFNKISGKVGVNTYYAIYVHEGTKHMPPRPFLTDALHENKLLIEHEIKKAFEADKAGDK